MFFLMIKELIKRVFQRFVYLHLLIMSRSGTTKVTKEMIDDVFVGRYDN